MSIGWYAIQLDEVCKFSNSPPQSGSICTPPCPLTHTSMEAIKKKMQAMKVEKDNACDRVDVCEEQCKAARVSLYFRI